MACVGQVLAQVTQPTLHLRGFFTTDLFVSWLNSKTPGPHPRTHIPHPMHSSGSIVGCQLMLSRGTPCQSLLDDVDGVVRGVFFFVIHNSYS